MTSKLESTLAAKLAAQRRDKKTTEEITRFVQDQRREVRARGNGQPSSYADASRSHSLERVRQSKASLERQADPLGLTTPWREMIDEPAHGATYEREAKAHNGIAISATVIDRRTGARAQTVTTVVEANKTRFTEEELSVAMALVKDAQLAQSPSVVAAYDGVPLGTRGPKHGGVPDSHREAYVRYEYIKTGMHPKFRAVMEWFVNEVLVAAGEPKPLHQLGTEYAGFKDKEAAKGVGIGLLKGLLWRVGEFYARDRALTRRPTPPIVHAPDNRIRRTR